MSLQSGESKAEPSEHRAHPQDGVDHGHARRIVTNWVLALLTVPAAALIVISAVGAAMSVAACSTAECRSPGSSGPVYSVLLYGAPAVAGLTIIATVFTAYRRRGFLVPCIGLALLLADFLAITLLV